MSEENSYKKYQKATFQEMRPYVPGEDMTGISIAVGINPEDGGMVARDPDNPTDQWYITKEFMDENYQEAPGQTVAGIKALINNLTLVLPEAQKVDAGVKSARTKVCNVLMKTIKESKHFRKDIYALNRK